jgi:hypothetical protein
MTRERRPWAIAEMHYQAASLRDCVGRAQFLRMNEIRILASDPSVRLLNVVSRWRLYQHVKWAELIHVMTRKKGH